MDQSTCSASCSSRHAPSLVFAPLDRVVEWLSTGNQLCYTAGCVAVLISSTQNRTCQDTSNDTPVSPQKQTKRKKITMSKTKKKITTEDEEFSSHEDKRESIWTEDDKSKLRSVVHSVPTLTADFWAEVSHRMDDDAFTPSDCQSVYHQLRLKPAACTIKRQTKGKEKTNSDQTVITGKQGTLKRKRQLRSALEEMDEEHNDDIFEYRRPVRQHMKRVKISSGFLTGDDNDEEEEETSDSCSSKCGVGGSVAGFSPVSRDILTDDFDVNSRRLVADTQVYRYNKLKKGRGLPLTKQNVVRQPVAKPQLRNKQLRDIRAGERLVMSLFEQTSDDDDSSDTEPAFNDTDKAYRELSKRFTTNK